MIKLLEKKEDEEKFLEEQWSHVLYDFNKKHLLTRISRNREIVEKPFLLEKRIGLAKVLEREAELENHPVIKDIYEKHLDNWKHQFSIYKISSEELSGHYYYYYYYY